MVYYYLYFIIFEQQYKKKRLGQDVEQTDGNGQRREKHW